MAFTFESALPYVAGFLVLLRPSLVAGDRLRYKVYGVKALEPVAFKAGCDNGFAFADGQLLWRDCDSGVRQGQNHSIPLSCTCTRPSGELETHLGACPEAAVAANGVTLAPTDLETHYPTFERNVGHWLQANFPLYVLYRELGLTYVEHPVTAGVDHPFSAAFRDAPLARSTRGCEDCCVENTITIRFGGDAAHAELSPEWPVGPLRFHGAPYHREFEDMMLSGCERSEHPNPGQLHIRILGRPENGQKAPRRVLNKHELRRHALKLFPDAVVTWGLVGNGTICEQAAETGKADIYLITHGAHMANMVFFQQNATVIEMFPYKMSAPFYAPIGASMGLHMFALHGIPHSGIPREVLKQFGPKTFEQCSAEYACRREMRQYDIELNMTEVSQVLRAAGHYVGVPVNDAVKLP